MNGSKQSFKYESIFYTISRNETTITIQLNTNDQRVIAEQSYLFEELKALSSYFNLFPSIQSIYEHLIFIANSNRIIIEDRQEQESSYCLTLKVDLKDMHTVAIVIPKFAKPSQSSTLTSTATLVDNALLNEFNHRFEEQDTKLNQIQAQMESLQKSFDSIQLLLNRTINIITKPKKNENKSVSGRSLKEVYLISKFDFEIQQTKKNNSDSISSNSIIVKPIGFLMQNEIAMLLNWLSLDILSNWKLLYHPVRGKDTIKECISACYTLPSIIILIESDTGAKFGGYTAVGWDIPPNNDTCKLKSDANAFLFSIDKKKRYKVKKTFINEAIACHNAGCLWFNCGLVLFDNFMSSKKNSATLTQWGSNDPEFEINKGTDNFSVKQLYIYQITD